MTHGDKAKGKKTASQASGKKSSSKAVQATKEPKGGSKVAGKDLKAGKDNGKAIPKGGDKVVPKAVAEAKKQPASREKAPAPVQTGGTAKAAARKPAPVADVPAGGFTNPIVANAFKRAVKKYPNAFRRLTD